MNIFVFTIVRLIFNLLASSKLISFPLIWLNFVITGTGSFWFVLGIRGSELNPDNTVTAVSPGWRTARLSSSEISVPGKRYRQGPAPYLLRTEKICPWLHLNWREREWKPEAAMSSLKERVIFACCCKPSLPWWHSPSGAAGVGEIPQHYSLSYAGDRQS